MFAIKYVQELYNSILVDKEDSAEIPILDSQMRPETKGNAFLTFSFYHDIFFNLGGHQLIGSSAAIGEEIKNDNLTYIKRKSDLSGLSFEQLK